MQKTSEWAKLLNNIYAKKEAICPNCNGNVKGTIYSNDKKIGFAILECENCKQHIKLSRINIPSNIQVNSF